MKNLSSINHTQKKRKPSKIWNAIRNLFSYKTLERTTVPCLVLILTGCAKPYNVHDTSLFSVIIDKMNNIFLGVYQTIDMWALKILGWGLNLTQSNGNLGMSIIPSNMFEGAIRVMRYASVALIIFRTGQAVFNGYFKSADTQYAPTAITMIKKVGIAIAITYLMPYATVTAWSATTYVGAAASHLMFNGPANQEEIDANNYSEMFLLPAYMEKSGIMYETYCEGGQAAAGVNNYTGLTGNDGTYSGYGSVQILMEDANIKVKYRQPTFKNADGSAQFVEISSPSCPVNATGDVTDASACVPTYKYFCEYNGSPTSDYSGSKALNVYQSLAENKDLSELLITSSAEAQIDENSAWNMIDSLLVSFRGLAVLFMGLALLIIAIFIFISNLKRVYELFMLMLNSWWFIGGSIIDAPGQSSIKDLSKKFTSLCLTQIIQSIEVGLFIQELAYGKFGVTRIPSIIIWMLILTSTPTAVKEMITPTGTAQDAVASGKAAIGAGKSFLGL